MCQFKLITLIFCISLIFCLSDGAPSADLVNYLPGIAVQPKFKHYSGYLQAGGDRLLHYWFVQSQSSSQPKDPVVLWLNGGPGCSSLDGLLSEHGPFEVVDNGTLVNNPFAWNLKANVLYLEAPAGVGFSYSVSGNTETDDDQTASDNALAVVDFFKKFPEFVNNDFFITGESYAGVYVPTLARKLMNNPQIRLRGFAVGNGLSSYSLNSNSLLYFYYYHGLIGEELWKDMLNACCQTVQIQRCNFTEASSQSKCSDVVNAALKQGVNVDMYNLYSPCHTDNTNLKAKTALKFLPLRQLQLKNKAKLGASNNRRLKDYHNLYRAFGRKIHSNFNLTDVPPCINASASTYYLNRVDVRKALHIPEQLPAWEICSDNLNYHSIYQDMTSVYLDLLKTKMRILIYNGDVDMACNFLGDEWFTNSIFGAAAANRRQWFYTEDDGSQQVGGWVKQFKNDRAFLTVRGSGHMVPQDKPRPALKMFYNFLDGKDY